MHGLEMGRACFVKKDDTRLSELDREGRYALQRAARETMKKRLLADILFDMRVCQLEGWDHTEYARDLNMLLSGIVGKFREKDN